MQSLLSKLPLVCQTIALSHSQDKKWMNRITSPFLLNTTAYGVMSGTQLSFCEFRKKNELRLSNLSNDEISRFKSHNFLRKFLPIFFIILF